MNNYQLDLGKSLLHGLTESGFKFPYILGGAVRNHLEGKAASDIDIFITEVKFAGMDPAIIEELVVSAVVGTTPYRFGEIRILRNIGKDELPAMYKGDNIERMFEFLIGGEKVQVMLCEGSVIEQLMTFPASISQVSMSPNGRIFKTGSYIKGEAHGVIFVDHILKNHRYLHKIKSYYPNKRMVDHYGVVVNIPEPPPIEQEGEPAGHLLRSGFDGMWRYEVNELKMEVGEEAYDKYYAHLIPDQRWEVPHPAPAGPAVALEFNWDIVQGD